MSCDLASVLRKLHDDRQPAAEHFIFVMGNTNPKAMSHKNAEKKYGNWMGFCEHANYFSGRAMREHRPTSELFLEGAGRRSQ